MEAVEVPQDKKMVVNGQDVKIVVLLVVEAVEVLDYLLVLVELV